MLAPGGIVGSAVSIGGIAAKNFIFSPQGKFFLAKALESDKGLLEVANKLGVRAEVLRVFLEKRVGKGVAAGAAIGDQ